MVQEASVCILFRFMTNSHLYIRQYKLRSLLDSYDLTIQTFFIA